MSSSATPTKLQRLVDRFKRHSNPKLRYQQLLSYAKKLPPLPESAKIPENKVQGCVSQVYIDAELEAGKIQYCGDSDAQLVKGLVAFLIEGLNNLTPAEVLAVEPDFITETDLNASLTPSRANGFYNIFQMMKKKALAFELATSAEQS